MKKTVHQTIQYDSGSDKASIHVMAYVSALPGEPDCVNLGVTKGGFNLGEGLTPTIARNLAEALLKAADQVDAWSVEPAEGVAQ